MKFLLCLALVTLAVPGVAVAQERQFPSEPSPPPLPHSSQNPLGPPKPPPPRPPRPGRPGPGGNALSGLVAYLDNEMQASPDDIEAPVTGYGNEALWDAVDTGSTAGGPNR